MVALISITIQSDPLTLVPFNFARSYSTSDLTFPVRRHFCILSVNLFPRESVLQNINSIYNYFSFSTISVPSLEFTHRVDEHVFCHASCLIFHIYLFYTWYFFLSVQILPWFMHCLPAFIDDLFAQSAIFYLKFGHCFFSFYSSGEFIFFLCLLLFWEDLDCLCYIENIIMINELPPA